MEQSVLVPYNGSQQSRSALTYAAETFSDATITVLYAIEPFPEIPEEEQQSREQCREAYETAHTLIAEARQVADDRRSDVTAEFIYGHPVHAVLRYASLYTFDQIVLEDGCDRAETVDGALGNITETIVRRADVPVTIVRSARDDTPISSPETILVPFDGSTPACTALEYAMETFPEATIHVLYIRYPFVDDVDQPGVRSRDHADFDAWYEAIRDWHAHADRNPEHILQIAESIASDTDVDIQTVVQTGNPLHAILDYLNRIDADRLTIGSHSRDEGTRILLGSVAQFIVRRASLPVTVIR